MEADIKPKPETEIYRGIIDEPSVWKADSLDKEKLVYKMSSAELDAVDDLLASTRALEPQAVTRAQFSHPVLDPVLAKIRDRILNGTGVVILRGITRDRYSEQDFERVFWGFGTHWGSGAFQNGRGDKLGHVRFEANNPYNRGYMENSELVPHTDSYEIVGLMCVQQGASGGFSRLTSSLAMHNEIFTKRPELLEPLYRGFRNAVTEARGTEMAVTPFNVPIFARVGDVVSCLYTRRFIKSALETLDTTLPADLEEALEYFEYLADHEDFRLEFLLEPGEMLVWNNFTMLHSRTAFQDSATKKRHLLRLWLNVPDGRPVVPKFHTWANTYAWLFERKMQC